MSAVWRWGVWLWVVAAALGVVLGLGGAWSPVLDAIGIFRIHFGLLSVLGGVLALGLARRHVKWIAFGAAALAFATLGPVWRGAAIPAEAGSPTRSLTVMTANIRGGSNPSLDRLASVLVAADADVLAIVEAPRTWPRPGSTLARRYPYSTARKGKRNGVFLLSRYPLLQPVYNHPDRDTPLFGNARVQIEGATLGVAVIHLSWPLVANNAQRKQTGAIAKILPDTAGRKILMGDFNAPPWSAAMRRVEENAGLRMIGGLRRTWRGAYPNPVRYALTGELYGHEIPALLGNQIDHILLSPGIGVDQVEVIPLPGSDHDAVWARLSVPVNTSRNRFASR